MSGIDAEERFEEEGFEGLRDGDLKLALARRLGKKIEKPGMIEYQVDEGDLDALVEWEEMVIADHGLLVSVLDWETEVRWDRKTGQPKFRKRRV